jgi:RluA family pseudouridine synthase
MTPAAVLYEDDAVLAVDKPVGVPTVPTADPSRASLVRLVEAFLEREGRLLGALGVHQRLDRDTSGVVLFVKDPRANAALAEAFARREVEKTYDAVTVRPAREPKRAFTIERALVRRGRAGMGVAPPGGEGRGRDGEAPQDARTDVVVREIWPRALLLEVRPRTGRKHQIRVHLASAGLPIVGDALYGALARSGPRASDEARAGRAFEAGRLMLHARRLRLRHPLTGGPLEIESPWPADFRRAVERLRSDGGSGRKHSPRSGRPAGRRSRARGGGHAGPPRKR